MVGIKGTGMTALAEILKARGAVITGSDSDEKFYTDNILAELGIPVKEYFSSGNITGKVNLVVYSSAYSKESNPELIEAIKRTLPCMTYPEALGILSRQQNSSGISGVHGKTTTTAIAGTITKELHLPVTVLAGSQVPSFENSSTLNLGDKYFIAETCEYQKHFLNFKPDQVIITTVELDHPDYFHSLEEIHTAFIEYALSLPEKGTLIYNADNDGTIQVIEKVKKTREDIQFIPYGKHGQGPFQITAIHSSAGEIRFCLKEFDEEFILHIPGEHNVLNASAAIALSMVLLKKEKGEIKKDHILAIKKGLENFRGSRRRSEIIGETGGILFVDDYAHHPTAIAETLKGYREFFPDRMIIVDFMSHTYSRTKALLHEFGSCFSHADEVILHAIYASAREKENQSIRDKDLYEEVKKNHGNVLYFHDVMEAVPYLKGVLRPGILFVTMGAGDNWKLGRYVYNMLRGVSS
ncbi:MAG: UDP-N-acetylmuramate--L-alanine ligase [Spirochaetales bacterium]|nr:UDP-N-acetylmuramate--L-alanine ligase [Spirochaetales bacterium]